MKASQIEINRGNERNFEAPHDHVLSIPIVVGHPCRANGKRLINLQTLPNVTLMNHKFSVKFLNNFFSFSKNFVRNTN